MKKKRRFINLGTMLLLSIIVVFLAYGVSYRYFMNSYDVFESYSKDVYDYLVEIAEKTITEGKGINTQGIPEDIESYQINKYGDRVIFEYGLKWNHEMFWYTSQPKMTITLSKDNKILNKESNYETKEKYIEDCKNQMSGWSMMIGLLLGMAIFMFYVMGRCIRNSEKSKPKE